MRCASFQGFQPLQGNPSPDKTANATLHTYLSWVPSDSQMASSTSSGRFSSIKPAGPVSCEVQARNAVCGCLEMLGPGTRDVHGNHISGDVAVLQRIISSPASPASQQSYLLVLGPRS